MTWLYDHECYDKLCDEFVGSHVVIMKGKRRRICAYGKVLNVRFKSYYDTREDGHPDNHAVDSCELTFDGEVHVYPVHRNENNISIGVLSHKEVVAYKMSGEVIEIP